MAPLGYQHELQGTVIMLSTDCHQDRKKTVNTEMESFVLLHFSKILHIFTKMWEGWRELYIILFKNY